MFLLRAVIGYTMVCVPGVAIAQEPVAKSVGDEIPAPAPSVSASSPSVPGAPSAVVPAQAGSKPSDSGEEPPPAPSVPAASSGATASIAPVPVERAEISMPDEQLDELLELLNVRVESASQQSEDIDETPSPVTVITQLMIERSGAKNLKDLLIMFVPGMNFVQDQNEVNVAMRGVYGSSQQKILIMQDGHRLNSRAYSEANPDFSISLEKIKQIEVLRGPGSSLYGNVALTGVINIVSKSGADVDGTDVVVGVGSFGERKLSVLHGEGFGEDHDLLLWAALYETKGERVSIPQNEDYSATPTDNPRAILNGFRNLPSYDVGLRYRLADVTLFANMRSSKYIEPFTSGGSPTGQAYRYGEYRSFQGAGPGLLSQSMHLGLEWKKELSDNLRFSIRPYYNRNNLSVQLVINPAAQVAGNPEWQEFSTGAVANLQLDYEFAGKGNVMVGAEVDRMEVYDSYFGIQVGGEWTKFGDTVEKQLLEPGVETIYSGFAQLKHYFSDELILNMGARLDYKDRYKGKPVRDIGPRLALIYKPTSWTSIKGSYSRSFVDAPYWYRYNSLASYRGGEDLRPEHLSSYQLTGSVDLFENRLKFTSNLFYNSLTDFIWRNNTAAADEPIYQNAGFLKSWGVENEVAYVHELVTLRANLTYQEAADAKNYGVRGVRIYNISPLSANLIIDATPIRSLGDQVWVHVDFKYLDRRLSPISSDVTATNPNVPGPNPKNTLPSTFLVNAGFGVRDFVSQGWGLDFRVYNALDTKWQQGGSVQHPYPQTGRWFALNLKLEL